VNQAQWKLKNGYLYACILAAISTTAVAQTAPEKDKQPKPADAEEVTALEKIVVTANRRNEELQKVSGVVQTISGDQLRKDGVGEIRNLSAVIPGSNISVQEGNVEIYIRGVGSSNSTELGDPAAATHFNGVYLPRPRGLSLMFYDLGRVEVNKGPQGTLYGRNAMAGTLNIIPAAPRLGVFQGYGQAEGSNRSGAGAEAALNIPLGEVVAIRAAAYYNKKDYGFTNSSPDPRAKNIKPAGLEENSAGRISAYFSPTEALRVTIVGDAGKERGTGYPAANAFNAFENGRFSPDSLDLSRVAYRGPEGKLSSKISGVMGKLEYDLGSLTAELNVSQRKVDYEQTNSGADGVDFAGRDYTKTQFDDYSTVYWQTDSTSKIAELRLGTNDSKARFKWNAGLFGFKEDQRSGFYALVDRGIFYSGTEFTMPIVDSSSKAAFADGTFAITKDSRVVAGLRTTSEKKYRFGIGGNWTLGLGADNFDCCISTRLGTEGFRPNFFNNPSFNVRGLTPAQQAQYLINRFTGTGGARDTIILQALNNCFTRPDITDNGRLRCPPGTGFSYGDAVKGIPEQQEGRSNAKYTDFRLGFEHDLNRDQMLYAKVSTGHKAGGFNDSFNNSPIPEIFKPEKVLVYEVGTRNAFGASEKRSVFNATGFYYDYTDQVFQDLTCINLNAQGRCSGFSLVNRNVGKTRILGAELEYRTQLSRSLKLDANVTLLDSKVLSGIVADVRSRSFSGDDAGGTTLINLAGNKLPFVSTFNFSSRIQHDFALGNGKFDWQALLNYRSAYFLSQYNTRPVTFLNGTTIDSKTAGFPDRQKGYATINLGAGYTFKGTRIEAFVTNVTNEQVSNKALVGAGLNARFLNDARAFGLRVRQSF
jgi:iron complex outermembrane recepter protein